MPDSPNTYTACTYCGSHSPLADQQEPCQCPDARAERRRQDLLAASIVAAPLDRQRIEAKQIQEARRIARNAWQAAARIERMALADQSPTLDRTKSVEDRDAEYAMGEAWSVLSNGGTEAEAFTAARRIIRHDAAPTGEIGDVDEAILAHDAQRHADAAARRRTATVEGGERIDPLPTALRSRLNHEPKPIARCIEQAIRPMFPHDDWADVHDMTAESVRVTAARGRRILKKDRPRVLRIARYVAEVDPPNHEGTLSRHLADLLGAMRSDARKPETVDREWRGNPREEDHAPFVTRWVAPRWAVGTMPRAATR